MEDLLELSSIPSLFAESCEVSSGKFEPDVFKYEARAVVNSCKNEFRKNIVTCKDPAKQAFLDEVDGLELNTLLSTKLPELPYYIPVFDRKIDIVPNLGSKFPFVALSLNDILSGGISYKAGSLHEERSVSIRAMTLQANCFKNKKVILFSSGPDTLIELIWYNRDLYNFFEKISKMGFFAATGFNFSLINGECPFSHALNIKRSIISSYLYEDVGVLTIPHIYALNNYQVNKWCAWLKKNTLINYFSINCQLQNSRKEISIVIQSVKTIFNFVPHIHAILHGFPVNRVKDLGEDIVRVHFADMLPLKKARNYRRIIFDRENIKLKYIKENTFSISQLVEINFNEKHEFLKVIKGNILNKGLKNQRLIG